MRFVFGVLLVALFALPLSCGGSASETPFPQSASEITSDPVLRHPRPGNSAVPMPPSRLPSSVRPPVETSPF